MQRLSGMDASFLYTETPTGHMHVTGVIIVDPSTAAGEYGYRDVVDLVDSRLHLVPMFRQRMIPVPMNVDHPVWIEDPDFDITQHVHEVRLPAPGTRRELAELVGDLASHPLDRTRPLWEMWVTTGASDGTIALITKMHHAAIDGGDGCRHHEPAVRPRTGRPPSPSRPTNRGSPTRCPPTPS